MCVCVSGGNSSVVADAQVSMRLARQVKRGHLFVCVPMERRRAETSRLAGRREGGCVLYSSERDFGFGGTEHSFLNADFLLVSLLFSLFFLSELKLTPQVNKKKKNLVNARER